MRRSLLGSLLALALLPALPAHAVETNAAGDVGLTIEEFRMYRQYKNALEDERVKKMPEAKRLPAIAKNAGFKVKDLEAAIEKGEAAGDLKGKCESAIKSKLEGGTLAGRVGRVIVDAEDPEAIAYVQWKNVDQSQLEEEAALTAFSTTESCPIASTIQVWAVNLGNPKERVFEARIDSDRARRFQGDRIKDFADTRYMRSFEAVKSAAKGDTFEPEPETGAPGKTDAAAPAKTP